MSTVKEYVKKFKASATIEESKKDPNKSKVKFDKSALMEPYKDAGLTEDDLKNFGKASTMVARGMYGALADITVDGIKAKVKKGEDFRGVSTHGTGRINKDLCFEGKVNAYKEGEITTKNEAGESIKKPWQSFGTGSVSMIMSGGGVSEDTQSTVEAMKEAAKNSEHYKPLV